MSRAWWIGVGSLVDLTGGRFVYEPKVRVEGFADDAARLYGDFVTAKAGLLEDGGDDE